MLVHIEFSKASNPFIEDFLQGVQDSHLKYYASELQQDLGYEQLSQLDEGIKRAMNTCQAQHVALDEHFKPIYRCSATRVVKDWKLSPLAYCLVMLNSNPAHPKVAQMQLALIRKGILTS